jgi:hypothetical protein
MSESALPEYRPVFKDIAILLAIPAILSAFHFFLPDATYNQLVFTYGDPSLVTVCHCISALLPKPPRLISVVPFI